MTKFPFLFALTFALLAMNFSHHAQAAPARIVFLGDSITDGHTYPLLIEQALRNAKKPVLVLINAGIGGDMASGMNARLERDVLIHRPDLVTLSAGINDAGQKISLEEYSRHVTAIADRLQKEKIELVILTTSIYGPKRAEAEKLADEYNAWLEKFAAERGLKIASVNAQFKAARAAGREDFVMETDGVHPNFEGQRLIARAVLDALGFKEVAVPARLQLELAPGVLQSWRIGAAPEDKALDAVAAQAFFQNEAARAAWREYFLPEAAPAAQAFLEQERQRGFAISLDSLVNADKTAPPAKRFLGFSTLDSATERRVFFNTGAHLQAVWLNGIKIYENKTWTGWHAGKERIPATLQKGRNTILIETGPQFFLSVTGNNDW